MLVLRFAGEALWRDCCDAAHMRRRWGPERALHLSQRLQQVEAMMSLDDLEFMSFDSHVRAGGVIEVAVDDDMSLFIRRVDRLQEDGPLQATVIVSAVGAQSIAVP